MKKPIKYIVVLVVVLVIALFIDWIIIKPTIYNCETVEITATKIYEGGEKDVFIQAPNGDSYYINRGLEQGFTIDEMKKEIKNKKVTLHLPKQLFGLVTSNHIAQLTCRQKVIYTEFK
ncbi:hypothetical protein POV27_01800 [Aureisphaera galaxeae]|uniref:hypothetical protein n=1 Tax=Aureisphaera galaxeae TaxID=1538023 RepID=UPI002350BFE2|nr:hypothetical protein [Aureisphaera galaxeae]MDC8002774.1 hypothetical protein [Aureisphaera galaxeae]